MISKWTWVLLLFDNFSLELIFSKIFPRFRVNHNFPIKATFLFCVCGKLFFCKHAILVQTRNKIKTLQKTLFWQETKIFFWVESVDVTFNFHRERKISSTFHTISVMDGALSSKQKTLRAHLKRWSYFKKIKSFELVTLSW